MSASMIAGPIYCNEICLPHLRGVSSSIGWVSISFGYTLSFAMSNVTNWRTLTAWTAGSCLVLAISQIILLPESHKWLAQKQRWDEAMNVLLEIRGSKDDIYNELLEMKASILHKESDDACHGIDERWWWMRWRR